MKVFGALFAALLLSGVLSLGTAMAQEDYDFWEVIDDSLAEEIDHS